jgi:hypothetical protein
MSEERGKEGTATTAPRRRRTSRLAIAAFVVSLAAPFLWFFGQWVAGPDQSSLEIIRPLYVGLSAAVLLGLIALARVVIGGRRPGFGLATAAVSISVLGMAVLAPGMYRLIGNLHAAGCMSNMEALSAALRNYALDHDGRLPPGDKWCDSLPRYIPTRSDFVCPEAPRLRCGYALNRALIGSRVEQALATRYRFGWQPTPAQNKIIQSLSDSLRLNRTVLLYESDLGWNGSGGRDSLVKMPRHRGRDAFLFADGHSDLVHRADEDRLIWNPPRSRQ